MNLSSVSNVAVNGSSSANLSSTRQSDSGNSFEQLLSAQKDASSATENASRDNNATSNTNNQQAAESASAQSYPKEQHTDKTTAQKTDANTADENQNKVVETDTSAIETAPIAGSSTLKNGPITDQEKQIKSEQDVQLALDEPIEPVVDNTLLSNIQKTTDHQDEVDFSSDTPDAATLSLLAMINQTQTTKTNTTSDESAIVIDDTLAPAQSTNVSLTLSDKFATTNTTAETELDTPLTPFTMVGTGTDSRQANRVDIVENTTSKKAELSTDSDDTFASNTALAATTVRSSESVSASAASNTSPLVVPSSHVLSATAQTTSAATSTVTTSTAMLNAQMGSEAWQQTLGQQIIMFARDGQQNAKLRLHPEELGSLQISLTLNNDNEAQLHFVSAHSQVRAALEAALPHLRTSLAESGIDLGQASVGSESSQSWAQDQQTSDPGFAQQSEQSSSDGLTTPLNVPASLQQMASGVTGVNIFA
ncbi:flagellar hook-length control protein FliK [Brenneria goodwinii]|uniref:flagellar hook-length control protein FliK n=1 Tax=Brenneria goodwinii TaxID=1109412 RepID=UPI0036E2F84C